MSKLAFPIPVVNSNLRFGSFSRTWNKQDGITQRVVNIQLREARVSLPLVSNAHSSRHWCPLSHTKHNVKGKEPLDNGRHKAGVQRVRAKNVAVESRLDSVLPFQRRPVRVGLCLRLVIIDHRNFHCGMSGCGGNWRRVRK